MKKFLLFLTLLMVVPFAISAKTTTITTTETKVANNSGSYVTDPTNVTVEGITFVFDEFVPTTGQMRLNKNGLSGFNLSNKTAIPGLQKIVITATSSDQDWSLGTWYIKTNNSSQVTSAATATTSNIQGKVSGSTVTFEGLPNDAQYFMLNLTSNGKGTVKFTKIEVTYSDGTGTDTKPTTITFDPNGGNISTTDPITLSANGTNPDITYSIGNTNYDKPYSEPFTLSEGTHTVYAKATNSAGSVTAFKQFTVTKPTPGQSGAPGNFVLVTSPEEVGDGGEFIIVDAGVSVAMSSTQATNNRTAVAIPDGKKISSTEISNFADLEILKVEKSGDYYTFYATQSATKGYLYAASSSANQLKTQASVNDNALASITFSGQNASIVFALSKNRNVMQYNGSSGSSLFACYEKASQTAIKLFKKIEGTDPSMPTVTVNGEPLVVDGKKTVPYGTKVTIDCENATHVKGIFNDADFTSTTLPYELTVTKSTDLLVQGVHGTNEGEDIFTYEFVLEKTGMPVVKIGEETLQNEGQKAIAAGTTLTITCKDAKSINILFNDDEKELTTEPFTYTINEGGDILITSVNHDGVESDEMFSYTFVIGEIDDNMPQVGSNFRQVVYEKDKTDYLKEDQYYVIGRHVVNTQNNFAMSVTMGDGNITATNQFMAVDSIPTIIGDQELDKYFSVITTTGPDVLILKAVKQGDDWAFRTVNYGDGLTTNQRYLSPGKDNNNNLELSEEFTPFTLTMSNQHNVNISFGGDYKIVLSQNERYFNLQQSALAVQLYEYSEARLFVPVFDDVYMVQGEGDVVAKPKNEGEMPRLSYRINGNTTIIGLNPGDNNEVTITAQDREGKATVIVTWPETDHEWFAGKTRFDVYIQKRLNEAEFGFIHTEIRGKKDIGVVAQAVHYAGTGTVTYDITRDGKPCPTEITIDAQTGMIRQQDLVNPKISTEANEYPYTVTASVNETAEHKAATATYTIYIEAPEEAPTGAGNVTYDFAQNGYGMYKFGSSDTSGSSEYELNKEGHEGVSLLTEGAINVNMAGDYRWFNESELRTYSNCTLKVSSPSGNITSVKFTTSNSTNGNIGVKTEDNSKGTGAKYSSGNIYTWTWTASDSKGASDITFTFSNTTRISTIEITSLQKSSEKEAVGLYFETNGDDLVRVVNTFVDVEAKLPELKTPTTVEFKDLVLDIDEISETDEEEGFKNYEINATDFDDINVTVWTPGVYTFRAKYEGDEYLKGMAILRLNAFPRLSVIPDETSGDQLSSDTRTEAQELTLIEPSMNEELGEMTVTVALPTLEELNDSYKFSTLTLNRVSIKDGDDIHHYEVPNASAVRPMAETSHDISEMEASHEFVHDGYVNYSLVYANTSDFNANETIHVIMMPEQPTVSEIVKGEPIRITPSKDAYLQYGIHRMYTDLPSIAQFPEDSPFKTSDGVKAMSYDGSEAEWHLSGKNETVEIQIPDDLEPNESIAVTYRSVKNLEGIVADDVDPVLASEPDAIAVNSEGSTTGIDSVTGDDTDANGRKAVYNLQGVRVYNPTPGNVYIVVDGKKAVKVTM